MGKEGRDAGNKRSLKREMKDVILQCDCLEVLKTLESESVDCVVTSPPYYGLRDYGVVGQIGLEPTLNEYLDKMLLITAELKRVLKKTGTMWWNHGDSYASLGKLGGDIDMDAGMDINRGRGRIKKGTYPEKSLLLQAHRLAIRMIDEQGWILRNQIIWHKPNVMPSSVKDRFTVDFEPIFFFSKSKRYWFEPQYEPHETNEKRKNAIVRNRELNYSSKENKLRGKIPPNKGNIDPHQNQYAGQASHMTADGWIPNAFYNPLGRNKRTVWKIATKPFKEAHFATFPETLIETPIKAGCPEMICKKCGVARKKIIETKVYGYRFDRGNKSDSFSVKQDVDYERIERGYTDCGCNAGWEAGIVLDPFAGACTTWVVAKKLNRNFIGIELNSDYTKICNDRLAPLLAQPTLI